MSHIASHVKIKSIRCVECCLSFATKETLMSHLHSSHSQLPKGICIDVSIENHERRYLQCKSDLLPDADALPSSKVVCTEKQQDSSEKIQDVGNIDKIENCIETATYKSGVTGSGCVKTESGRSAVSDIDDVESSSSSISLEKQFSSFVSQTDNVKGSTNSPVSKTARRKLRKPSHVVTDGNGCLEIITCANNYGWVEIVAATQPMTAQCLQCSFTCNTELQLKVQFSTYSQMY